MRVLFSPAKLNLFLEVKSKRSDGFHNIETLFVKIGLYDLIYMQITDGNGKICVSMEGGLKIQQEDNLCYLAVKSYLSYAGITDKNVYIKVKKHIPVGAGLGGGSSNAATVLKELNSEFRCFNEDKLRQIGLELGSDVPFFLLDNSWAIGRGRGEILSPINFTKKIKFLLIYPNIEISTRLIYSALKLTYEPVSVKISISAEDIAEICFNRLFDIVGQCYPYMKEIWERLCFAADYQFFLTGSGSSFFAPYERDEQINWKQLIKLVVAEQWHLWCVESV